MATHNGTNPETLARHLQLYSHFGNAIQTVGNLKFTSSKFDPTTAGFIPASLSYGKGKAEAGKATKPITLSFLNETEILANPLCPQRHRQR
jgi:hypothetical protein